MSHSYAIGLVFVIVYDLIFHFLPWTISTPIYIARTSSDQRLCMEGVHKGNILFTYLDLRL
jgi:hypothetical protein